jgi:predicted RNA polymerase sigma factor
VELNRAIAIADTEGPETGLRIVEQLGLDDFRYLHSTRAELLRRLARTDQARTPIDVRGSSPTTVLNGASSNAG